MKYLDLYFVQNESTNTFSFNNKLMDVFINNIKANFKLINSYDKKILVYYNYYCSIKNGKNKYYKCNNFSHSINQNMIYNFYTKKQINSNLFPKIFNLHNILNQQISCYFNKKNNIQIKIIKENNNFYISIKGFNDNSIKNIVKFLLILKKEVF